MQVLLDSDTTTVSFIDKETSTIFICFNSLGMDSPNLLDFYSLSKTFSIIFVTDKTSSWGNHIDWKSVADIINPIIDGKDSYSIGVSMGGTNSVISSNYLNTGTVISFNPQYSIHPEVFPESEYRPYADKIKNWIHTSLKKSFSNSKTYYTFVSSGDTLDIKFLDRYPKHIFDCGSTFGHNLAFDLKNAGLLSDLLSLLTEGAEAIESFLETRVRVDKDADLR